MSKEKKDKVTSPRQMAWRQRSIVFFIAKGALGGLRNARAGIKSMKLFTDSELLYLDKAITQLEMFTGTQSSAWESLRDQYPTWDDMMKVPEAVAEPHIRESPLTEEDAVPAPSPGAEEQTVLEVPFENESPAGSENTAPEAGESEV